MLESLPLLAASPNLMADLRDGSIFYLILALSIALHEYGHAKAADLIGDPLPRLQGRVTLDPLAHLDPIGTGLIPLSMIFLPIFMGARMPFALIGWGRPVQISLPNPRTRVRDEIVITVAGPLMNVLIALVAAIVSRTLAASHNMGEHTADFLVKTILLNCGLIAFNVIPLPPLDGSRILRHIVRMSENTFNHLAMNSWWILLILINLNQFQVLLHQLIVVVATPFLMVSGLLD
jgi:Zn-dependent protease